MLGTDLVPIQIESIGHDSMSAQNNAELDVLEASSSVADHDATLCNQIFDG
ncbi:MAG: hypothetical protein ACI9NT_000093 [Bacteroidia bacterium]|jgi:hypothetical protein